MRKSIIPALFICLLGLFACQPTNKSGKGSTEEPTTERSFTDGLTKEDTLAVEQLVNTYMTYAKNQEYSQAAAMLFKPNPEDAWYEPVQLDNEEMARVIALLKQFPIADYQIAQIEFRTAIDNTVKCTIAPKEASKTPRNLTFRPMNYLGGWRLCLMN